MLRETLVKNQKSLFAMCCILATLVAGCGSSSTSTSGNGVFLDADVVGASYTCGSQTATTGTGGAFMCASGSTATFSVGGITLCTETAQAVITPVSCAQAKDPTANASTPSVVALVQFLMSINTTPTPSQESPSAITVTASELQAAKNLSLDFSTATQAQLLAAVVTTTGNAGATLVTPAAAEAEITNTVLGSLSGKKLAGTYGGSVSGTWSVTIGANGSVSGTATTPNGSEQVSGNLTSGTTYSGTAGSATWTGHLDTSKTPAVFSGTWNDPAHNASGTFTGTVQS
jgi:hypothetical protein